MTMTSSPKTEYTTMAIVPPATTGNLTGYIETKFSAQSIGAVGELIKITSHALG